MASLATARTRLGPFGYATRRTGSFLRLPEFVQPELGLFGGYVEAEDAVATLLAAGNGLVTMCTATDEALPAFSLASDAPALSAVEFLALPGVDNNCARTPDSVALSITGDLDLRIRLALDNYVPGSTQPLMYKWHDGVDATKCSYSFAFRAAGQLCYFWSQNGTAVTEKQAGVLTGLVNYAWKWFRVTHDVDNGAGGNDVKFWLSDDYNPTDRIGTWAQFGATQTTAGVTSIFDNANELAIGRNLPSGQNLRGKVSYAEVLNGIDGPTVAKFDPANDAKVGDLTFISGTGEEWTIVHTGNRPAQLIALASSLLVAASDGPVTSAEAFDA